MRTRQIKSAAAFLIGLLLVTFIDPAHGNDAVYYGSGATVYPIKNDNIQLVSEVIKITKGVGLGWGVEAILTFKNHGNNTTVQMGFPFDTDGPNDPDEKEEDVPNPEFRTFIDNKEIRVTKKKGWSKSPLQDLNFPIVYTFTVPFEKGETKSIRHTYSVQGTEWSNGEYQFQYILRTGALWKDKIKDIKISMLLPGASIADVTGIAPKEQKKVKKQGGTVLSWEFHNIKPDFKYYSQVSKDKN